MIKKKNLICIAIILLPILIFWLGRFRFTKDYLIVRDIPFEKIDNIKCDFWKDCGGYYITGHNFLEVDKYKNWEIKNDTLYIKEKPVAKTISLIHRCLINDYTLTIQSLDDTKIGYYVSK